MFIPPTPPDHPDEHLRVQQSRKEEAEREDQGGQNWRRRKSLSTGDIIIFLVIGVALLAGVWFFTSWLLLS